MNGFDTIVLGLGATGSAALYQLARRGSKVLGIDRYSPPHAYGSSHGETRITRLAIGEGAHYTPLAIRSHELWREIERQTGCELLMCNGGLIISSSAKTAKTHVEHFFSNTVEAARKYGIAHEFLDAAAIRRRFPAFNVDDDEVGYFERDAGFLRPEQCVDAQLGLARDFGATIVCGQTVERFDARDRGVTVTTDRATYSAATLVIAAGPWLPALVDRDLAQHFAVYRQTLYWFAVDGDADAFAPDRFPVFIWELKGRRQGVYGFPAIDGAAGGIKIGTESFDATTTADDVDRNVPLGDSDVVYDDYIAPFVRGVSRRCIKTATCLYTVTPDFGFVVDRHPASERVIIVSPCSGHGFKHSPAIGEALAQWIVDGESVVDLRPFRLSRLRADATATRG